MNKNLAPKADLSRRPISARQIELPKGVNDRLQNLLDRQNRGKRLTVEEKREPECEREVLEESAELYAEIYSEDEDLRELTKSA